MPPEPPPQSEIAALFERLAREPSTLRDRQIEELQQSLTAERDARREDRFVFIVALVILFDVAFFAVMPSFGGPLALLILELLVLIPLARRMGMQEIATILDRVLGRIAGKAGDPE